MAERRHGGRRGDACGGGRGGGRGDLPNEEAARQRDLRDIENDDLRQQVRDLQCDIENGDLRQQVRDLQRRLARLEERRGKSNPMKSNAPVRRSMDDPSFSDIFTSFDADEPSKNSNNNIFSMPGYDTPVYDEDICSMPVYDEDIFYELPGLMKKSPPPFVKFDNAVEDKGVAIYDDEEIDSTVGYLVDCLQQLSGSTLESQVEDPMVTIELIAINTKGLRRLADEIKSTGRGSPDEDSSDSSPLTNKDVAAGFDDVLTDAAVAASSSRFAPTSKYFMAYFAKDPSGSPSISPPTTKHDVLVGFDEKFVIRNSFLDKEKWGSKVAGIQWNFNGYGGIDKGGSIQLDGEGTCLTTEECLQYKEVVEGNGGGFGSGKRGRLKGSKNRKILQVNHGKKRKKRRRIHTGKMGWQYD